MNYIEFTGANSRQDPNCLRIIDRSTCENRYTLTSPTIEFCFCVRKRIQASNCKLAASLMSRKPGRHCRISRSSAPASSDTNGTVRGYAGVRSSGRFLAQSPLDRITLRSGDPNYIGGDGSKETKIWIASTRGSDALEPAP